MTYKQECSLAEYIRDIIKSFQEISNKDFILNLNQDDNL